jgi:hypothetical protein
MAPGVRSQQPLRKVGIVEQDVGPLALQTSTQRAPASRRPATESRSMR